MHNRHCQHHGRGCHCMMPFYQSPEMFNPTQVSPEMMYPGQVSPEMMYPGQVSPEMFNPTQVSPEMFPGQLGPINVPPQVFPTQMAPERVSPTRNIVRTNVYNTVVRHIHPTHTTHVNKHVIHNEHYFPHTESVENECYETNNICGEMPKDHCRPPKHDKC
ncbi:CotD family spore coat protein [Rummeliibacillus sp. JY-2-4R]